MNYNKNAVMISGEVITMETFKTRKGIPAINLQIRSVGRFVDIHPCVAYGLLSEYIKTMISVGTPVIILGRSMNIPSKEAKTIVSHFVIEEIGIKLVVPESETETTKNEKR